MRALHRVAAGAIALAVSSIASGCGYCDEDRIAATYDYSVVAPALAQQHEVAFFAIRNRRSSAPIPGGALASVLESARGIDPRSFRVSAEAATLSFAYDPARVKLDSIVKGMDRKLAALGLDLSLIRVMDSRSASKPVALSPR